MEIYHQNVFDKWLIGDRVIQSIITSPPQPYYSLRKYQIPDVIIGGKNDCQHEFSKEDIVHDALRYKGSQFQGLIQEVVLAQVSLLQPSLIFLPLMRFFKNKLLEDIFRSISGLYCLFFYQELGHPFLFLWPSCNI